MADPLQTFFFWQAVGVMLFLLLSGTKPFSGEGIKEHFRSHLHPECRIEFECHGCNPAISVPTDSRWLTAARGALTEVFGREARLIGTGGSIPAVGSIREILGIDSLLVGFGLDDDNVHAPNEKFELTCLRNGIRSHAAMLEAFAGLR